MTPEEKKEKKRLYDIEYRKKNKDKIKERKQKWAKNNQEKINKNKERNKLSKKISDKKYFQKNKDKINLKKKEWVNNNIDKVKSYKKKYFEKNKDKINEYARKRRKTDKVFKLISNIRKSIYSSIKRNGYSKKSRTHEILGCSFEEFKFHLESKFEPWMNWSNYGLYNGELNYGWDIDHIIPTSSAITEEDVIKLNHYTNLQPLCSKINRDLKRDIIF
jgi:hypothetical protein